MTVVAILALPWLGAGVAWLVMRHDRDAVYDFDERTGRVRVDVAYEAGWHAGVAYGEHEAQKRFMKGAVS